MIILIVLCLLMYVYLISASITDIKTKEVPIPLSVFGLIVGIASLIKVGNIKYTLVITAGILILYIIVAYFGSIGGADIIAFVAITLQLSFFGIFVCIISHLISLFYLIFRKDKKTVYPFIPFITVAYTVVIIFISLRGVI